MKKNGTIILTIGMFICLSSAVVADSSFIDVRQHADKQDVWQVATGNLFEKSQIKEYILKNITNLKEWGLTEGEIIEKAARSPEQTVKLKKEKEALVARSLFNFYQPTKELVVEKTDNTFSVKVIIEKEDTAVGHIMIIWIVFLLAYYYFLITGFKSGNEKMLNVIAAFAAVAATFAFVVAFVDTAVTSTAVVATTTAAVALSSTFALAVAVALIASKNKNKKVMFIASFIHYSLSLLLFHIVSDIWHTIIPMIAVPAVFALSWILIKYKN